MYKRSESANPARSLAIVVIGVSVITLMVIGAVPYLIRELIKNSRTPQTTFPTE